MIARAGTHCCKCGNLAGYFVCVGAGRRTRSVPRASVCEPYEALGTAVRCILSETTSAADDYDMAVRGRLRDLAILSGLTLDATQMNVTCSVSNSDTLGEGGVLNPIQVSAVVNPYVVAPTQSISATLGSINLGDYGDGSLQISLGTQLNMPS